MNTPIEIVSNAKVKLSLTADQWQLYADMPGAKAAARKINSEVAKALNKGDIKAAYESLRKFRQFGATDTEPCCVLLSIMEKMGLEDTYGI
jgi:hypothetical protein